MRKLDIGSDSDRSSGGVDLGKTYTVPIALHNPMIYGSSSSVDQQYNENYRNEFGSTYTKNDQGISFDGDRFSNVYRNKSTRDAVNDREGNYNCSSRHSIIDKQEESEISEIDARDQKLYNEDYLRDKTHGFNSCPLSENSFNIRPQITSKNSGSASFIRSRDPYSAASPATFKRDHDTTSNDGSECTVISLGRKIQLMAATSNLEQVPKNKHESEDVSYWDSEWKQLLKQNHELLLKLSSREDNPALEISSKRDYTKTVFVHNTAVQTNTNNTLSNVVPVGNLMATADDTQEKSDSGICSSDVKCEDEPYQSLTIMDSIEDVDMDPVEDSPLQSDTAECLLEDIIEESSQSGKSTPRHINSPTSPVNIMENTATEKDGKDDDKSHDSMFSSLSVKCDQPSLYNKNTTDFHRKEKVLPKATLGAADFSCTADLPTYRVGLATGFVMKSLFPYTKKMAKSNSSKDLLDALQMIEDEEIKSKESQNKDSHIINPIDNSFQSLSTANFQNVAYESKSTSTNDVHIRNSDEQMSKSNFQRNSDKSFDTPESSDGDSKFGSSPDSKSECAATLPVIQVLVEKVFLFTQDLAERWKQNEIYDQRDDFLKQLLQAETLLEDICIKEGTKEDPKKSPDLHSKCEEKARKKQEEFESRIQKNLDLIRKLLDDKKLLTDQCEQMQKSGRIAEKKHSDKVKLMEDRHNQELKSLRERMATTEQEKREKWLNQKTRVIKESTYRGLDSKMKDLSAKHRDEISQLKAQHWEQLKESEEKFLNQMRSQEDELKKKFEEEKEDVIKREREREQQRLDIEIRQCEQRCVSRLEELRKQHENDLKAFVEERHQKENRLHADHESAIKEVVKAKNDLMEQLHDRLKEQSRKYEEELSSCRREDEKSRSEWRTQFMREHDEARMQSEKELRDKLKRQRDKEIERAIKEMKQEFSCREQEDHRSYETKIKNTKERYEAELTELETSEREARTRYLEMKSVLAQKEEEVVYLRARLHTQDMELCELQHMFQPPGD